MQHTSTRQLTSWWSFAYDLLLILHSLTLCLTCRYLYRNQENSSSHFDSMLQNQLSSKFIKQDLHKDHAVAMPLSQLNNHPLSVLFPYHRSTPQVLLVGSAALCLLSCSPTSSSSPATLPDSSIQDMIKAIKYYARDVTEPLPHIHVICFCQGMRT